MNLVISAFAIAMVLVWILVPYLTRWARRVGLVDRPDARRKLHKTPIPMVGGIAVFVSVVTVACSIFYFFWEQVDLNPGIDFRELTGLLVGSVLLILVGLIDDRFGLRGRQKLLGQIIAVTALIASGYYFDELELFGFEIDFGIFAVLIVYGWMLAAINSINLLDGADGFAATIGLIMCTAMGLMAMRLGHGFYADAIVAFAFAGALLGFLRFNFPPARAFLGDHGSMLIGFVLGALAIRCSLKSVAAYAFFAPIAILAIPFIDTGAAIIRRRLTGRSIYTVDRGHIHHRLQKEGYGPRTSLLWMALLSLTTAAGGVLSLYYTRADFAVASIVIVVLVMFFARIFGVAEFRLVSNKVLAVGRGFLGIRRNKPVEHQNTSVHMQGSRDWQELWGQVCQFAEEHDLVQITMDLNVPWMHESFHATQRRSGKQTAESEDWYAQIPLVVQGRVFGRIEVIGDRCDKFDHHHVLDDLTKISHDIEMSLADMETDGEEMGGRGRAGMLPESGSRNLPAVGGGTGNKPVRS